MNPNNALSAWQLTVMAVVVVAALAAWLTLVLLADRPPRHTTADADDGHGSEEGEETAATVTELPSASRSSGKKTAA